MADWLKADDRVTQWEVIKHYGRYRNLWLDSVIPIDVGNLNLLFIDNRYYSILAIRGYGWYLIDDVWPLTLSEVTIIVLLSAP